MLLSLSVFLLFPSAVEWIIPFQHISIYISPISILCRIYWSTMKHHWTIVCSSGYIGSNADLLTDPVASPFWTTEQELGGHEIWTTAWKEDERHSPNQVNHSMRQKLSNLLVCLDLQGICEPNIAKHHQTFWFTLEILGIFFQNNGVFLPFLLLGNALRRWRRSTDALRRGRLREHPGGFDDRGAEGSLLWRQRLGFLGPLGCCWKIPWN